MSGNGIREEGARMLSDALKVNTSLTSVNMNGINEEGKSEQK